MSDFSLKGFDGSTGKPENLKVRKLNDGVTPEEIKKATKNDNIDEVVVKVDNGDKYIVYADELKYTDGHYKDGDLVYSSITNSAKANPNVSFIDDEQNENSEPNAGIASLIGGGILKTSEDVKEFFKEDYSKIKAISEPVSDDVKNEVLKSIK